jgi:hypothetical protein
MKKSIIAFVTYSFGLLQQQYIKTNLHGILRTKKVLCISENPDNKLVAIDTIKWMETPLLKAI